MEVPIPGAGPLGGVGYADLVYGNEIWEVKPDQPWWRYGTADIEQLQRYISHRPGSVPGSYIPPFVVPYGNEQIVVRMYPRKPGILYYKVEEAPQQPLPVPVPAPEPEEERGREGVRQSAFQPAPLAITVGVVSVPLSIWLMGKLLAPACGPLAPVCAIGF
jgi:hypothetical protein